MAQQRNQFGIFATGCGAKRGIALSIDRIAIGSTLQQELDDGAVVLGSSHHERQIAISVRLIGVGMVIQQRADQRQIAVEDRLHQRSLAMGIPAIDLRPFVQESLRYLRSRFVCGQKQHRTAIFGFGVGIGAFCQQVNDLRSIAALYRFL